MDIEKRLSKLRSEYIAIGVPDHLKNYGYESFKARLAENVGKDFGTRILRRGLVFAALAFFLTVGILFGVVSAAQAAVPGDKLYSIKRLSETVILRFGGDGPRKVERRAQEVIDLAKENKDPKLIEKASQDYKSTVDKTKQEVKDTKKENELNQKLDVNEQEFKKVIKDNPGAAGSINEAIRASQEGRDAGENRGGGNDSQYQGSGSGKSGDNVKGEKNGNGSGGNHGSSDQGNNHRGNGEN